MSKKKYVFTGVNHNLTNEDGSLKPVVHGDVVELSDHQAHSFRDKFKPESVYKAEVAVKVATDKAVKEAVASVTEDTEDGEEVSETDTETKPAVKAPAAVTTKPATVPIKATAK